jgi:RNA-directed DNA polymerase
MPANTEKKPATVPQKAKQAGETHTRWDWVEPCVWTERMLSALETGVKGSKWYSLIDKVCSTGNLRMAFNKTKANKGAAGVDHVTIEMYERRLEENLENLNNGLREGIYQPSAIRRTMIPKPGKREMRPLGIPTVKDRIVQGALRNVMEPIFERDFAEHSYGFRPGRGCKDALRRVDALLKAGYLYVVDADLKSYFDTIPHDKLVQRIEEKIADKRILELVRGILSQRVLDDMKDWKPASGTPQGAVISPLLSNIYLDQLDHLMEQQGYEMVRYADDLVILCKSCEKAQTALSLLQEWTTKAGLTLHPEKTRIVNAVTDGFDFLGYRFWKGLRLPSNKSLGKFKDNVRAKTSRTRGDSIETIITDVNLTLKGWFEYFKQCHLYAFSQLDKWVRMRLRCVLRKHLKLKGIAMSGNAYKRWPNAFFVNHGLFNLETARKLAWQSVKR